MEAILASSDNEYLEESSRSCCALAIWLIQEESEEKGPATRFLVPRVQLVIRYTILIRGYDWLKRLKEAIVERGGKTRNTSAPGLRRKS